MATPQKDPKEIKEPKKNPDDVDTKAEDHAGDETRYRVLAPPAPTVGFTSFRM